MTGQAEHQDSLEVDEPTAGDAESKVAAPEPAWKSTRNQIVAGVIVGLILTFVTPLGHRVVAIGDGLRDYTFAILDYDAGRVEQMRERVAARPYWQGKPKFLGDSIAFLNDYLDAGLVTRGSGGVGEAISVDDLLRQPFKYDGKPIVLVGRQRSFELLEGSNIDLGVQEVTLTGESRTATVVAGNAGVVADIAGDSASGAGSAGDAVAFIGVPLAVGRVKTAKDPTGRPRVYFAVTDTTSPDIYKEYVRPLAP